MCTIVQVTFKKTKKKNVKTALKWFKMCSYAVCTISRVDVMGDLINVYNTGEMCEDAMFVCMCVFVFLNQCLF